MTALTFHDRRSRQEAAGVVGGLFERHGRMVYGICRAMLRDVHEAEDATQQVFLSAYQAMLGGAAVREPGGWLATIARNECRARIRAGMKQPLPVADEDLHALPAVGDEHERRARLDEIRASLASLPERQREAVVLRYLYGLRYAEVATALGLSRPATEALLFRARRSLRIRLRPLVGAVLVVPVVVRDELALALPGFGATGSGAMAAGATGGVFAKLAAGPIGVKAATAVVAVSAVGAVGTVPSEQRDKVDRAKAPRAVQQDVADALAANAPPIARTESSRRGGDDSEGAGRRERRSESSGPGSGGDEGEGHSGDDRISPAVSASGSGQSGTTSDDHGGNDVEVTATAAPEIPAPDSGGENSGPGGGGGDTNSGVGSDALTSTSSGPSTSSGSGSGESGGSDDSSGGGSGSSGRSGGATTDD